MKRKSFIAAILIALGVGVFTLPSMAENQNLITNASAESLSSTGAPLEWKNGSWGQNTAVVKTANPGYNSNTSLDVTVSNFQSGDVKWMHTPVAVTPGQSYIYSNWYKSNAQTEIDIEYQDINGTKSYAYVTTVAPSSIWKRFTIDFTVPAGVSKLSVMHLLATNGTLAIDEVALSATAPTPPLAPNPPTPPINQAGNLLLNASMEEITSETPAGWHSNTWGTNAASFTHEQTGRTGTKSVTTNITTYTSGDAKWYAAPVNVTQGKKYIYSDFYRSNVATRVVAAFINVSGTYQYAELAPAPASENWNAYMAVLTIPAGIEKMSLYHVIDSVGFLTLDDASLTVDEVSSPIPTPTPTPAPDSGIVNSSLETANGTTPQGWLSENWGQNTASFEYANQGRTGTKSVKATITNYISGDAKWYPAPMTNLKPGSAYRLGVWYKTNAAPRAVAMFNMPDGTTQYLGMPIAQPSAQASTTWQYYTDTFTVPEGTVSASAFLFIDQNGWLQTDDYSLAAYTPSGFNRPLLSLTFDDGHEDNVNTALPLLNSYGYKTTQCYATEYIKGMSSDVIDGVMAFAQSGHEICSHTISHPFLTQINDTQLKTELTDSQSYLKQLTGQPVTNFATPYGDYNQRVLNFIRPLYASHRSVDEGYNSKDSLDRYNIKVQNILSNTTATEVAGWVQKAKVDKTWLVLVYHRVADDPGTYDTTPELFKQQLSAIKASGITVKTYNDALTETTGQF